mmetsp:Transcript_62658/g.137006  ORF Transcript_62658/g.137006 Transcript_62658/m.137006 type:complete len:139 (-) Transcript_62658:12-428(-)
MFSVLPLGRGAEGHAARGVCAAVGICVCVCACACGRGCVYGGAFCCADASAAECTRLGAATGSSDAGEVSLRKGWVHTEHGPPLPRKGCPLEATGRGKNFLTYRWSHASKLRGKFEKEETTAKYFIYKVATMRVENGV